MRWNVGFRREFIRNAETRIDLFGEWRNGRPYSYTFDTGSGGGRDPVFGVFGNDFRHLLYVPTGGSDPLVFYPTTPGDTTQAQLEAFIAGSGLRNYRGQIAGKNIARSPDWTKIDLRIQQTVPLFGLGRLRLFADMENVLNFIDNDWGVLRQVPFFYAATLVDVTCVSSSNTTPAAGTCPAYRYSNFRTPTANVQTNPSLWAVRIGARIEF